MPLSENPSEALAIEIVKKLISQGRNMVDNELLNQSEDLLNHDEYEMAFELVLLGYVRRKIKPAIDLNKIYAAAVAFNLDSESVYEGDFWNIFNLWLSDESLETVHLKS